MLGLLTLPRAPRRADSLGARAALALLVGAALVAGCPEPSDPPTPLPGLTVADHTARYFPISAGPHAVDCAQCHLGDAATEFTCVKCHAHETQATDLLHETVASYAYESVGCVGCHPAGVQDPPFDHASGLTSCATCHADGAAFARLPRPHFTHPDQGGVDCSRCHFSTNDWATTGIFPRGLLADTAQSIDVPVGIPRFVGTSIVSISDTLQRLPMPMSHATQQVDRDTMLRCGGCHNETSTYYPGRLHSALANQQLPQPERCAECHRTSVPTGFVGATATDPPRDPASAEMRHDAVAWLNDAPTLSGLVPLECNVCHQAPTQGLPATWALGAGPPTFHDAIERAALPQPDSCIDCHANTRPAATFTDSIAVLPAGVVFDHTSPLAQSDCVSCHAASTQSWSDARFHSASTAVPSTCLPCHEGQRPTSIDAWRSPTFRDAPFDFVTNSAGITHGAGRDCVMCHDSSGTGTWGVNANWESGDFPHGAGSPADQTCIACHSTQRPDLVLGNSAEVLGFDHANDGTGDCIGCHQASVQAGIYGTYFSLTTGTLPGGDWAGGVTYPGSFPIGAPDQFITVTELGLVRSGPNNLVTAMTTTQGTLYSQMVHTSAAVPAALDVGSPAAPNENVCWHCHTNTNGTVTSLINGRFHTALDNYRATPGAGVTALPQPTARCAECHDAPTGIVERAASPLEPMDHAVLFQNAVLIGGVSAAGVAAIDCGTCHTHPGDTWTDGAFHPNIAAAVPADCTQCHYPTVANAAVADVVQGTEFAMHHASPSIPFQNCQQCHSDALARGVQRPVTAELWAGGVLHAQLAPQPSACVECHTASEPAVRTQSSVTYVLAQGSTATNTRQWMSHTFGGVLGQDCARCHAADARAAGAAWSTSTAFHAKVAPLASCVECHGNGAAGTSNNMPAGVIDTATLTTASSSPSTGVPVGTHAQISHDDANVALNDCKLCHTQVGPSAVNGVAGNEWAQARFHDHFTGGNPLRLDGNAGRCSNCHVNVKPRAGYTVDHSTFTNVAGSRDCSSCHAFPGTGTPAAPNWLGAEGGFPSTIAVGGFLVPQPPASTGATYAPGIAGLPHPSVGGSVTCASCHTEATGGKNASGYDHASPLISTHCASCHEAGSNLVNAAWNGSATLTGGAGDTRPFTIAELTVTTAVYPNRSLLVAGGNHFYGIDCDECHARPAGISVATSGAAYDAAWAFPHDQRRMTNPSTCIACHGQDGLLPVELVSDPLKTIAVDTLQPTYAGTSIVSVTPLTQTLPMPMDHLTLDVSATVMSTCTNCHTDAVTYYPGALHSSLENLKEPAPAQCAGCHFTSMPTGFVGALATDPPRNPASGEMKHDAVVWLNDAPTLVGVAPIACGTCHVAPSRALSTTWAVGTAPAVFHDALAAAALPQPDSCIDCHANTRPDTTFTSANATMPVGVAFNHSDAVAMGDCVGCHDGSNATTWSDGQFHGVGDATPSTCLPCHANQRPTSTATWVSTTYANSPFDYVTNAAGILHGAGQDCVLCHARAGTGTWGINQNWQGGAYNHNPSTLAGSTCISCHSTQRADRVLATSAALLGFDHATAGTGDCFGCHQQTVVNGGYAHLMNPVTNTLPGGDWAGGVSYPGDQLAGSQLQFIDVTQTKLVRSGPFNLVTGTSPSPARLYNQMLHTSSALPAQLNAGPSNAPDETKCFHCHTNTNGTVTTYVEGVYHDALTNYRATPNGALAPFPQPTTQCLDCHVNMRPSDIVQKGGSFLQPMDHNALFLAPVVIGGQSASGVGTIECAVCHTSAGNTWSDGVFHANIGSAVPQDCTVCHYMTVANKAAADVTNGVRYTMKHASAQVMLQNCKTCHTSALAAADQLPVAATLWSGGTLHPHVAPQPGACLECHAQAAPAASTQSTVTYVLPKGGTATNGGQWMNHKGSVATGRDCAQCHAADATPTATAWSKSRAFHAAVPTVTTCNECHGLTNGNGSVAGTRNNLPVGLTDSTMVTSAASDVATGVPAGTKDQISHTDLNVAGRDCTLCHTQVGPSAVVGVTGKEWTKASFHTSLTGANALMTNDTTARCSNCHLNVKPVGAFVPDHSAFTAVSGSTDCASCHSWPGTGTPTTPNWLGASGGFPPNIAVGGFFISSPPAANATTAAPAVAGLPHPTPGANACTACHTSAGGGKNAIGYDHASTVANKHCNSCHEAGSNLLGTKWNNATTTAAGAGDTRPFTLTSVRASYKGNSLTITGGNHFFAVDCYECHNKPVGLSKVTTGAAYTTAWKFPHVERNMTNPATCRLCHGNNIPD